jgi:predicted lactoylglutathione lyase
MAEQEAVNFKVVGSNPTRRALLFSSSRFNTPLWRVEPVILIYMKIKRVVTCLPTRNPQKSHDFYKNCFNFPTSIEENMVTVEVSNLDLFLIEEKEFGEYLTTSEQTVHFPKSESQVIFSLAVESKDEIKRVLEKVEAWGGKVTQSLQPNKWQQETCFVQDFDGHIFEIVWATKVE